MNQSHPPTIYGAAVADALYAPFDLHIDPMERLLLINFTEDPDDIYIGFEPQVFDDEVHGQGMLVIGWRVDGRVDVYHQPSLKLDPATYDIAGDGLAEMVERPLSNAHYTVNENGVDATFAFADLAGRPVEVTIQENSRRTRKPFGLLAPMGSAASNPSALPLVLLHDFYFVRRADTVVSVQVDGQERRLDNLPMPIDGSRMYFTRYSPDPLIATLNPAHHGPLAPLERVSATEARSGEVWFDLVENQGQTEITAMRRAYQEREVNVAFAPPLPNLLGLADGVRVNGRFTLTADPTVGKLSGEYEIARQGDRLDLRLTPSGGWQPNESKWSVRFIYRVARDFTQWPKTYVWTAVMDLSASQPTLQSAWQRTE
jgi:hypothetical protein